MFTFFPTKKSLKLALLNHKEGRMCVPAIDIADITEQKIVNKKSTQLSITKTLKPTCAKVQQTVVF